MRVVRHPARSRLSAAVVLAAAAIAAFGCFDRDRITEPEDTETTGPVSNPVVSSAANLAPGANRAPAQTGIAYVWLPPDSVPDGEIASVHNTRTGRTVTTAMLDGGFDPVPVIAEAGDRLDIEIVVSGGGVPVVNSFVVPVSRKPRVVRTRPLPRKRDIVLNARPIVVFSEPVNEGTVGGGTLRLLRDGQPVAGRVTVSPDGLRAEFTPDQLLAANTDYLLTVTTGVTDLTGDALENAVEVAFTTGTTTASAVVSADPAALFSVSNGELRTFEFEAILHEDGRVTGEFRTFNPALNVRAAGRVTCVSVVDGKAAWVGGIIDELVGTLRETGVGMGTVWRTVDNGPPGNGVPDMLSLISSLPDATYGTAEEFCDETRPAPRDWDEFVMYEVEFGGIAVTGRAPPRHPAPLRRLSGVRGQVGEVGKTAPRPFRVVVLDANGNTVPGSQIEWAVSPGGGSIDPQHGATVVDPAVGHAVASAVLTFGSAEGEYTVTATAPGLPGAPQVTFTATAVTKLVAVRGVEGGGFVPQSVSVPAGRSVAWAYADGTNQLHDVTFEDDPNRPPSSGVFWQPTQNHVRTFESPPRTIRYRCTYHSSNFEQGEGGTVLVESAAGTHTCGMSTRGTLHCWGGNVDGQLGSGTPFHTNGQRTTSHRHTRVALARRGETGKAGL